MKLCEQVFYLHRQLICITSKRKICFICRLIFRSSEIEQDLSIIPFQFHITIYGFLMILWPYVNNSLPWCFGSWVWLVGCYIHTYYKFTHIFLMILISVTIWCFLPDCLLNSLWSYTYCYNNKKTIILLYDNISGGAQPFYVTTWLTHWFFHYLLRTRTIQPVYCVFVYVIPLCKLPDVPMSTLWMF